MRCITQPLTLLLVCALSVGCTFDHEHTFSGMIRRDGFEPVRGTFPMGGSFGATSTDRKLAIFGFPVGLIDYTVAVVYDVDSLRNGRLQNGAIREVYRVNADWSRRFDFKPLLDLPPEMRALSSELTPLRGNVMVEQWSGNVAHRVRVDLTSDDGTTSICGTFVARDRLDPNPLRTPVFLLGMTGALGSAQGRALAGSQPRWPPLLDWQAYDGRGERVERGVAVLIGPRQVLVPTSLAARWERDERRLVTCAPDLEPGNYPAGWSTPIVVRTHPLARSALSLVELDHEVGGVDPTKVHNGPASGEAVVIVRDTLDRIVRGKVILRGVAGERVALPRLDDEAKALGGVAVHPDTGHLLALLDATGRVMPTTSIDVGPRTSAR